jgi:hypothetical protein
MALPLPRLPRYSCCRCPRTEASASSSFVGASQPHEWLACDISELEQVIMTAIIMISFHDAGEIVSVAEHDVMD